MKRLPCLLFAAAALLVAAAGCGGRKEAAKKEILLLCGGSMRAPMEAVIAEYNGRNTGIEVVGTYGGSGELMAQLRQSKKGDIYVCHDPFMEWGVSQGIIDRFTTVGYLDVVIAVTKGNPKNIRSVRDLARPGIRLGVGDDRYSTSGYIVTSILERVPFADGIRSNIVMQTKGHQARANDVALGSLDATIIWNAVARVFSEKLDTISIPKEYIDAVSSATYKTTDLKKIKVTVGVTASGAAKKHVAEFYRFIEETSPAIFVLNGFAPLESGDNEKR